MVDPLAAAPVSTSDQTTASLLGFPVLADTQPQAGHPWSGRDAAQCLGILLDVLRTCSRAESVVLATTTTGPGAVADTIDWKR